jgi:hypothetical protein
LFAAAAQEADRPRKSIEETASFRMQIPMPPQRVCQMQTFSVGTSFGLPSSDLRERLLHFHMGLESGATNSLGVGSGLGSAVRTNSLSGVDS